VKEGISLQEIILAGDALVVHLDCPPVEAEAARAEAHNALREWRRVSDAGKAKLGIQE